MHCTISTTKIHFHTDLQHLHRVGTGRVRSTWIGMFVCADGHSVVTVSISVPFLFCCAVFCIQSEDRSGHSILSHFRNSFGPLADYGSRRWMNLNPSSSTSQNQNPSNSTPIKISPTSSSDVPSKDSQINQSWVHCCEK